MPTVSTIKMIIYNNYSCLYEKLSKVSIQAKWPLLISGFSNIKRLGFWMCC